MPGYLIKDTTREERKKIVEESLGNTSANCDGCMAGLEEMKKEIREINMEFNARYVRGDMEKEERRSCPL
ncbi:MAG: purine biosynthesis protein PurH [Lachnospiraceae bacterium]